MPRPYWLLPALVGAVLSACTASRPVTEPPEPAPAPVVATPLDVSFYETPVRLQCGHLAKGAAETPLNDGTIARFLSTTPPDGFDACLQSLRQAQAALELNDWAYFLLVRGTTTALFPGHATEATLLAWHLLVGSGYEAELCYDGAQSYLLLASDQHIVDLRQVWRQGRRYYLVLPDPAPDSFQLAASYAYEAPTPLRPVDFVLRHAPRIKTTFVPTERKFRYGEATYQLTLRYNEALIHFLEDYPRGGLPLYFESPFTPELEEDLVAGLGPLLQDKSEADALNVLLAFVQRGFRYKEDLLQFGHERYLLPDEMVFYPFSDCEDRSIFFASLVRRFLQLDVIGLRYPNHIATAVRTTTDLPGLSVTHEGQRYVVADPSFFGAGVGAVVPQVAGIEPELILRPGTGEQRVSVE